ncbi:hypothetical protein MPSEU_000883900 [Mayamaea pseudoterrestris]|nr:hypothetical protein MPSEU_000883900 [Mayamaea pseudoterrestris]
MYSDDWTPAEETSTPAATTNSEKIPSNNNNDEEDTPSRDLFEGDLFSDDLMDDIYNSSVADEDHHDHHHNAYIANLLGQGAETPAQSTGKVQNGQAEKDDDGFGAFRPSTSFNDLTTLLPPEKAKKSELGGAEGTGAIKEGSKKRKNSNADGPASVKKKASPARGGNNSSSRKPTTPVTPTRNTRAIKGASPEGELKASEHCDNEDESLADSRTESGAPKVVPPKELSGAVNRVPVVDAVAVKPHGSAPNVIQSRDKSNFKSLAQAAVSSLISTAKTADDVPLDKGDIAFTGKVDTSTSHVKALTGNNWVTASASVSAMVAPAIAASSSFGSSHDAKLQAERARARPTLTADDRAKQNRDRNREHARNTRLRKKAYVDELKRTLVEVVNQRDAAEVQRKQLLQRDLEQREVRFRVSEEFLKLRGRNEKSSTRWAAILEDGFAFTLPITSYRSMVDGGSENNDCQQQLLGVHAVMEDADHLSNFLQTLEDDMTDFVTLQYRCDRTDFFMDGCFAVLEWEAIPYVGGQPSHSGLTFRGSFRAKFSPASNKLITAKIAFDTGVVSSMMNSNRRGHVSREDASDEAANQANAILDSLEMPHVAPATKSATIVPASEASYKSCDDSSDESSASQLDNKHEKALDQQTPTNKSVVTRRSQRLAT